MLPAALWPPCPSPPSSPSSQLPPRCLIFLTITSPTPGFHPDHPLKASTASAKSRPLTSRVGLGGTIAELLGFSLWPTDTKICVLFLYLLVFCLFVLSCFHSILKLPHNLQTLLSFLESFPCKAGWKEVAGGKIKGTFADGLPESSVWLCRNHNPTHPFLLVARPHGQVSEDSGLILRIPESSLGVAPFLRPPATTAFSSVAQAGLEFATPLAQPAGLPSDWIAGPCG